MADKIKPQRDYTKMSTHDLLSARPAPDLLQYLKSRQALRDEALGPLLHENAGMKARSEFENLRQGGTPQAVSDLFHKTAAYHEGESLPMLPSGQVDVKTALQSIQKSVQSQEQRELDRQLLLGSHEQTTTTVAPSGEKTVTGQMVKKTGEPVSPLRTVSSESPNAPKAIDDLVQQKDKKNHERGLDTAIGALRVARNVLSNPHPSNAEDGLLIDSFLKAANPSAVIRPSMIDFVQKQTPFADQLKKKWDQYLTNPNKEQLPSGAILTETDRRQMSRAFQQYNQAVSEDSRDHYTFLKRRAEKQNLANDLDEIFSDEEQNVMSGKNFVDIPDRDKVTKAVGATPAAAAAAPAAATPVAQAPAKPIPTVSNPADAPEDAEFYMSPDGRKFVNRKYKPAAAPAQP